jgi:hypothetical protein
MKCRLIYEIVTFHEVLPSISAVCSELLAQDSISPKPIQRLPEHAVMNGRKNFVKKQTVGPTELIANKSPTGTTGPW